MGPDELGRTDYSSITAHIIDSNEINTTLNWDSSSISNGVDGTYSFMYSPLSTSNDISIVATGANARFDILSEVKKMPDKEKQELLKILLDTLKEPGEEKKEKPSRTNYLKQIIKEAKKTNA